MLSPYPSYPYPLSHPAYLATLGALFGMEPPPVEQCRVLGNRVRVGGQHYPNGRGVSAQFVCGD